jgi:hypothetical protein
MTKPLSHDVAQDLDPLAVSGAELHTSPRRCQAACLALRVEQFLAGGPCLTGAPRARPAGQTPWCPFPAGCGAWPVLQPG